MTRVVFPHLPVTDHLDTTHNFEVLQTALTIPPSFGRNVREFGAKGSGGDDTTAFARAFLAVQEEGGNTLFVPHGTYGITHLAVLFPTEAVPIRLIGAGPFATTLQKLGTDAEPMMTWGEHGTEALAFPTPSAISSLSIRGVEEKADGLEIEKCAWFLVENVDIRNCKRAIFNRGALTWELRNSILHSNEIGFETERSFDATITSNVVTLKKNVISNNKKYGVKANAAFLLSLDNNDMEENGETKKVETGGIYITNTIGAVPSLNRINQCWMEGNFGRQIIVEGGEVEITSTTCGRADPGVKTTTGQDIFIGGATTKAIVHNCGFALGEGASNILVDHECHGGVDACQGYPPTVEKTLAPSFLVEEVGAYMATAAQGVLGNLESKGAVMFGTARDTRLFREAPGVLATDGYLRANVFNMERSIKKPTEAVNLEIFVNVEDGKLYYRDGAGVSHALY